jgi:hypothetical protein
MAFLIILVCIFLLISLAQAFSYLFGSELTYLVGSGFSSIIGSRHGVSQLIFQRDGLSQLYNPAKLCKPANNINN